MNAKLPKQLEQKTLKDVPVGVTVYVTPWAMVAELSGNLWIDDKVPFGVKQGGTMSMEVTRVENGYVCNVHSCDYKWTKEPLNTYILRPVIELIT